MTGAGATAAGELPVRGRRVLVTGGAGFIGSSLCEALAPTNQVTVFDDFSSGKPENVAYLEGLPGFRVLRGDVRDAAALAEAVRGAELVYHLAVSCLRVSIRDPMASHEVNATGTLNLCRACHDARVGRLVYVSSSEVYGTAARVPMDEDHPCEPITVYGASKLAGEKYAAAYHRTYGLATMIVRPFNTYGPREHLEGMYGEVIPKFAARIMNGRPPVIFGDGTQTRDFTYVEDTVRGIVLASASDAMVGRVVNVARGQEVSIRDLARIVAAALGRPELEPVHEQPRPGDVHRHFAGVARARELFGFAAPVGIEEGVRRYLAWLAAATPDPARLLEREVLFNW